MRIDEYRCLVTDEPAPGCYGDSCANTARLALLPDIQGKYRIALLPFRTPKGFLRHPDSPWREDDFTSDQALPLVMALVANGYIVADTTATRLKTRTGDGRLSSPGLMVLCRQHYILLAIINVISALIFKLPYRWSDSKKRFERNDDNQNSGDHLNWFAVVCFFHATGRQTLCRISRLGVSKKSIKEKIHFYYRNEPSVKWMLDEYDAAIEKIYEKD